MFSIINSKSVNDKIQIKRSNTHNSEHNSDVNSIRQKTLQRTISCYLDPSNNVIIPSTKSINFY